MFTCDGSYHRTHGSAQSVSHRPHGNSTEKAGWCVSMRTPLGSSFVMYGSINRKHITNNVAELTAMIQTLRMIRLCCPRGSRVVIQPDSHYVILGMICTPSGVLTSCTGKSEFPSGWMKTWLNNGWVNAKREKVKNKSLWLKVHSQVLRLANEYNVEIKWVKGHENEDNILVDKYAKIGALDTSE